MTAPDPSDPPLAVVPLVPSRHGRPEPPDGLPRREARLWRAIVAARRPGWIDNPGSALTLRLYCQAVAIVEDLEVRARRDVHFIGRLNRQTTVVLRLAKELGLLPIRRPRVRIRLVRDRPHHTPPWSA
jgi:hypothetical protein